MNVLPVTGTKKMWWAKRKDRIGVKERYTLTTKLKSGEEFPVFAQIASCRYLFTLEVHEAQPRLVSAEVRQRVLHI